MLTFQGKTQSVAMWSRETGINQDTLKKRLRLGWDTEKLLTTPVNSKMSSHHRTAP
jgi:hypothetical protein